MYENQGINVHPYPYICICNVCTDLCTCVHVELHRDKRIARDDEYSDSEDEGEDPSVSKRKRNEHSFNKIANKRPRLTDDNNYQAKSGNGGKNNQKQATISSPLPPEPSPITPLPQDEAPTSQNKSMHLYTSMFWFLKASL